MGKNYDAYQKAVAANNAAKTDYSIVSGGATQERIEESATNAYQAQIIEDEAWDNVMRDPNG